MGCMGSAHGVDERWIRKIILLDDVCIGIEIILKFNLKI
jgi:hypothetical protein